MNGKSFLRAFIVCFVIAAFTVACAFIPVCSTSTVAATHNPEGAITVNSPPTPADGSTVYGEITIQASANWGPGVAAIQVWQAGDLVQGVDNEDPRDPNVEVTCTYDTAAKPDGPIGFTVLALILINNSYQPRYVDLNYTIVNAGPQITWQNPADGSIVSGTVDVRAQVTDAKNKSITQVRLSLDSTVLEDLSPSAPSVPFDYSYSWDTEGTAFGGHNLKLEAWNEIGESVESTLAVYIIDPDQVRSEFYFAEGTTRSNFKTYLCLGNCGEEIATVVVTFISSAGTFNRCCGVDPRSRLTLDVQTVLEESARTSGLQADVSMVVRATTEIVAERPIYFDYNSVWPGGSDAVGAPAPARTWYFAEGTTRAGFESYLCLQNPNSVDAVATVSYMRENEGLHQVPVGLPAASRITVNTVDHLGPEKDFSIKVESTGPIVVERPMYFNYQGLKENNWSGGHDVLGGVSLSDTFYFAEGATYPNFEEWLCLQNPSGSQIEIQATYMLRDSPTISRTYQVPPNQRKTISVNQEVGENQDVSVKLTSEAEFMAERPLYFDYHGPKNYSYTGGHNVVGTGEAATEFFFAEGYTGSGFDQWFCLQNPGEDPTAVTVTYYIEGGGTKETAHNIPAQSRQTIYVNQDAGEGLALSAKISAESSIVCERPIYFDYHEGWIGGHDVAGYTMEQETE